jgi:hypothetical protein
MFPQGDRAKRERERRVSNWEVARQADQLRQSLDGVIDEKMFAKLARHGNTSRLADWYSWPFCRCGRTRAP